MERYIEAYDNYESGLRKSREAQTSNWPESEVSFVSLSLVSFSQRLSFANVSRKCLTETRVFPLKLQSTPRK